MATPALTEAIYYILLSLLEPMHGYGIMQNVEQLSGGRMRLAAGTLYGALNNLLEKGWIDALPEVLESRKKEYVITDAGKVILEAELKRLGELYKNGIRILGGNMNWKIKRFEELSTAELYEILRVRAEVFVVEQDCVYQDLDLKDQSSWHLFLEEEGMIVAYLRILPKGISYPETAIGRVLTKQTHRRKGLGREMMKHALKFVTDTLQESTVHISAQAYLQTFYESLGFRQVSEIYLEDGIPHMEMIRSVEVSRKEFRK